ncbi:hypothetical protein [Canibacter zhoujuaniae]|uniref:hypothetical protein n=1 Tax=Canibacter zhoujuaniae TaxID=2708343 RepID=UPI0014224C7D|nr:hypothetical protein [Canibacter zhoujuaniae]
MQASVSESHASRGFVAGVIALFASSVGALAHTLAGAAAPSLTAIVCTTLVAWPFALLATGRRWRAPLLTLSVLLTQTLFHWVFVGMAGLSPTGFLASSHQHSHAVPKFVFNVTGHAGELFLSGAQMFFAHALVAALTTLLLLNAAKGADRVQQTVSYLRHRLQFCLHRATVSHILPPKLSVELPGAEHRSYLKIKDFTFSGMRFRGPPAHNSYC